MVESTNLNMKKIFGSDSIRNKTKEKLEELKILRDKRKSELEELNKKYPMNEIDRIWIMERTINFVGFKNGEFLIIDDEGNLRITRVEFNSRGQKYHSGFIYYSRWSLFKKNIICPAANIKYFRLMEDKIVFGFKDNNNNYYVAEQFFNNKEIKVRKI